MNLYEHTIVARQDTSTSQLKQLTEKYTNIVVKNKGEIVQTQNWGLLNLAYMIKKDKNLLRYMTVKVKKFDLESNYFSSKDTTEVENDNFSKKSRN